MQQNVRTRTHRAVNISSWVFFGIGIVLLGIVSAAYVHRAVMVRRAMHSFEEARQQQAHTAPLDKAAPSPTETSEATPSDDSDEHTNPGGRRASRIPMGQKADVPLAILRIPKIHLAVPVLTGTDEITLNRGVGQIAGTAAPGERGNIGIAGHRDGFFRNLKDINQGDVIELETTSVSATYVVEHILITGPDDISVLQPSGNPTLTLVTCYPFHFIGPAPRRFVVQASLK
jgi:sortase A